MKPDEHKARMFSSVLGQASTFAYGRDGHSSSWSIDLAAMIDEREDQPRKQNDPGAVFAQHATIYRHNCIPTGVPHASSVDCQMPSRLL